MDKVVEKAQAGSRRAVLWGGAAALLAVAAIGLYPSVSRWARAERSVDLSRVRVAEVMRGDLVRDLSVQGRIVAAFHPKLFSPARGIVTLHVRPGEDVAAGAVLATVESPEMENELQQQRSRLQTLQSELGRQEIQARRTNLENEQEIDLAEVKRQAAEREMRRAELLRQDGLVNDSDYEKAQDELQVAGLELEHARQQVGLERETLEFEVHERRLQVERQELALRELERRVAELRVVAPFNGKVAGIDINDKDAVERNQPLLTVVDLSRLEVEIQIPESYADEVLPGVAGMISFGTQEFPGEVMFLSPEVNASQVEGRVAFHGDGPVGLKQNQRVTVRIILDLRPDVLMVPRGPFLESGGGRRVYVLEDGLATLRDITTGAMSVSEVEILEGLREGDQILLTDLTRFQGANTVLIRD